MTLKSRLEKLERDAARHAAIVAEREKPVAVRLLEILPLPEYMPEDIWKLALELLADGLPDSVHPWTGLEDFIEWCRANPAYRIVNLPDPLLDVCKRAAIEIGRVVELPDGLLREARERWGESWGAETADPNETCRDAASCNAATNPS